MLVKCYNIVLWKSYCYVTKNDKKKKIELEKGKEKLTLHAIIIGYLEVINVKIVTSLSRFLQYGGFGGCWACAGLKKIWQTGSIETYRKRIASRDFWSRWAQKNITILSFCHVLVNQVYFHFFIITTLFISYSFDSALKFCNCYQARRVRLSNYKIKYI